MTLLFDISVILYISNHNSTNIVEEARSHMLLSKVLEDDVDEQWNKEIIKVYEWKCCEICHEIYCVQSMLSLVDAD